MGDEEEGFTLSPEDMSELEVKNGSNSTVESINE